MIINLLFPAISFDKSVISGVDNSGFVMPQKPGSGGFIDYDLFGQRSSGVNQGSGVFTPGIFTQYGSLTSGFLAQYSRNDNTVVGEDNSTKSFARLNTLWQKDDPSNMRTYRVGDTYSSTGMWGKAVGFAGIQVGRDFSTQPSYVTFPRPSFNGEVVGQSSVDLYINHALARRDSLSPGPFSIDTMPVITGAGMINVVTTDIMGRQQTISMPYYASGSLLKPGLHDYSYEAGFIRENYATNKDLYRKWIFSATDRVGITNNLTGEYHAEALKSSQALGAGASYLLGTIGVIDVSAAGSHSEYGVGGLGVLGFQRSAFNGMSFGIKGQATTEKFRQAGIQSDQLPPKLIGQAFVGIPVFNKASFGISYTQQNNRDTDNYGYVGVNYSQSLFHTWSLSLSGMSNVVGPKNKEVFLSLSRSISDKTSLSLGANVQPDNSDQTSGTIQLSRGLPSGSGFGYDLYTSQSKVHKQYKADILAQSDFGTYRATVAQDDGNRGYQIEANGAITFFDSKFYLSRRLNNGFAIVEIPGYSDVKVYSENQLIGKTDKNGKVFVPGLLPYQKNHIRVDANDFPMGVEINDVDKEAVPYRNSGLIIKFPAKHHTGSIVKLVNASSSPIPAGATVIVSGQSQPYYVADDGEAYLADLNNGANNIIVRWDDTSCHCVVNYKPSKDPIQNIGTIVCGK
jgi:outer membrane usher protein